MEDIKSWVKWLLSSLWLGHELIGLFELVWCFDRNFVHDTLGTMSGIIDSHLAIRYLEKDLCHSSQLSWFSCHRHKTWSDHLFCLPYWTLSSTPICEIFVLQEHIYTQNLHCQTFDHTILSIGLSSSRRGPIIHSIYSSNPHFVWHKPSTCPFSSSKIGISNHIFTFISPVSLPHFHLHVITGYKMYSFNQLIAMKYLWK